MPIQFVDSFEKEGEAIQLPILLGAYPIFPLTVGGR